MSRFSWSKPVCSVLYVCFMFSEVNPYNQNESCISSLLLWYSCSRKGLPLHVSGVKVLAKALIYWGVEVYRVQNTMDCSKRDAPPSCLLWHTATQHRGCWLQVCIHPSIHPCFFVGLTECENEEALHRLCRLPALCWGEEPAQEGGGSVQPCSGTACGAVGHLTSVGGCSTSSAALGTNTCAGIVTCAGTGGKLHKETL